MDITGVSTSQPTQTAASSQADTGKTVISSDFNTFLKMLTVQMQNQDPLNPIDSSDYAVQLATFSGVEQQVRTNDLLAGLASQMTTSGMGQIAAWVGMEARVVAPAYFDGSAITVSPNPPVIADRVDMIVRNEAGTEVERIALPVSAEPVQWTGQRPDGSYFPQGKYSFEIVGFSGDSILTQDQAEIYAPVQEVRSQAGQQILMLPGGVGVLASNVTALRDPSYF